MSLSKRALLASALALGLTSVGFMATVQAQTQNTPGDMLNDVGEDEAVYYKAETGKMTKAKVKMTAAHHTKAMAAGAKEITKGTKPTKTALIYKHGGKLYMLENKPGTAAGKTMIQEQFQDVFDGNHQ
ncbi:MAG: hypothetical protein ACXWKA_02020 [Xanthobacteraceae bacterium]